MDQRTVDRVAEEFPESVRSRVLAALETYTGPERERVQWDILELSKGNLKQVEHFVANARMDYRDILYWAEYYGDRSDS
jgi:hypothetical protein